MKLRPFWFLFYFVCLVASKNEPGTQNKEDPDVHLDTLEIIASYGYPAEKHTIVTEDGYILCIHRIPHSKFLPAGPRPVVFFLHGMFAGSETWVTPNPIAFYFSDAGYDVWIGNFRGTKHSKQHIRLSNDDQRYWDFSLDELALYDLPACFNYILELTKEPQLTFIGHALGTTAFFALASSTPDFNDKIDIMIALSPVAYVAHSPLKLLLNILLRTGFILDKLRLGDGEFDIDNKYLKWFSKLFCRAQKDVCSDFLLLLYGSDSLQLDEDKVPAIIAHTPTATSWKAFEHNRQNVEKDNFCRYDYGENENLNRYNSTTPPCFDLSSITIPVALFYSDNDKLVDHSNLKRIHGLIPNLIESYRVPFKKFNNVDFQFAKDWQSLLYNKILETMISYDKRTYGVYRPNIQLAMEPYKNPVRNCSDLIALSVKSEPKDVIEGAPDLTKFSIFKLIPSALLPLIEKLAIRPYKKVLEILYFQVFFPITRFFGQLQLSS